MTRGELFEVSLSLTVFINLSFSLSLCSLSLFSSGPMVLQVSAQAQIRFTNIF